jgi:hypothetical protein
MCYFAELFPPCRAVQCIKYCHPISSICFINSPSDWGYGYGVAKETKNSHCLPRIGVHQELVGLVCEVLGENVHSVLLKAGVLFLVNAKHAAHIVTVRVAVNPGKVDDNTDNAKALALHFKSNVSQMTDPMTDQR